MISIQDVGLTILSDNPSRLYVLGGTEYGIKDKYIETLRNHYHSLIEYPSVEAAVEFLTKKHLVPVSPSAYVVRYDEKFVNKINDALARKIKSAKFEGTLVLLYSDNKSIDKIDKYLPEFTCVIPSVDSKFVEKYLHQDFPKLDDRSIKIAVNYTEDYSHARNVCKSMANADLTVLNKMSESALARLFGCESSYAESEFAKGVAAKDFKYLMHLLDHFEGDFDSILYTFLQTAIELDKIVSSKYSNSELKEYAKYWKPSDIYYLFMHTYDQIDKLRTVSSGSAYDSLVYLSGLLTFRDIPSLEAMTDGV